MIKLSPHIHKYMCNVYVLQLESFSQQKHKNILHNLNLTQAYYNQLINYLRHAIPTILI